MNRLTFFALLLIFISCKTSYLDTKDSIVKLADNSYLDCRPYSNLYHFENDIKLRAGRQFWETATFEIELPKNILEIRSINYDEFLVSFPSSKYYYIDINQKEDYRNTVFSVNQFKFDDFDKLDFGLNLLDNVSFKNNRSSYVIQGERVSIYVFNLYKDEVADHIEKAKSFRFINENE